MKKGNILTFTNSSGVEIYIMITQDYYSKKYMIVDLSNGQVLTKDKFYSSDELYNMLCSKYDVLKTYENIMDFKDKR